MLGYFVRRQPPVSGRVHVECGSLLPLFAARACPGLLLTFTTFSIANVSHAQNRDTHASVEGQGFSPATERQSREALPLRCHYRSVYSSSDAR
jgi:hypothetical protein